jgi:oxygen-dependent protoporphyrinogen oxidase
VVFLGYRRAQVDHPLDGLGYLTPAGEGRALSGALFCSTMFSGRAPAGHVALAGYIGGARAPGAALASRAELIEAAREEFRDLLGARGDPVAARVRQWPRGLPQYRLGHGSLVAALDGASARRPGLFVTGNYLAGPAVGACVARGLETAARAHTFLTGAGSARPRGGAVPPERDIGATRRSRGAARAGI